MAAKTYKTKPFRIAVSGSTIDGRTIDDQWIGEVAKTFNRETYQPRVNIEHIRGISADPPFQCYGDVAALSVGEVELDFGKGPEKRKALFAEFELFENAKKLADAGQKVFTSMEVEPDWFGTKLAGLAGVAMTDSPASAGTQRLQFSRSGDKTVRIDSEGTLEFVESAAAAMPEADGFFKNLNALLGKHFGKAEPEPKPEPKVDPADPLAAFSAVMGEFAKSMDTAFTAQAVAQKAQFDALEAKVTKLASDVENTAAPGHQNRPKSEGFKNKAALTDC